MTPNQLWEAEVRRRLLRLARIRARYWDDLSEEGRGLLRHTVASVHADAEAAGLETITP